MATSDKRGPGRPLTPGNQPGADGCPQLRLRLEPEVMEQVRARGGPAWARRVILEALEAREGARGEEER